MRPEGPIIFFLRPGPPLSQGLDDRPPRFLKVWIRHYQFALKKERKLVLLKLHSIIFCTDLVTDIDIDLDREKVYFTTRYTGVTTR